MKEEMMKRACNALMSAKGIGDVYFSCVFVVGNELTFSRNVAERMVEDAKLVHEAKVRTSMGNYITLKDENPDIKYEVVTFEEAYKYLHGTEYVPERVMRCVYKEMDASSLKSIGYLYVADKEKEMYDSAVRAAREIRKEEKEQEKMDREERALRRKANSELAKKKKAEREKNKNSKTNKKQKKGETK